MKKSENLEEENRKQIELILKLLKQNKSRILYLISVAEEESDDPIYDIVLAEGVEIQEFLEISRKLIRIVLENRKDIKDIRDIEEDNVDPSKN